MKIKKCRHCKTVYQPYSTTQKACSVPCSIELVKADKERKRKREISQMRSDLRENDKSWHMKATQKAFNEYIRLRDKDLPCISCQRHHRGQYHAGHFKTIGANPELRFTESNCHKQCAPCNNHKSGDIANYRINLVEKIGLEQVEWLEGPHDPKNYIIADLKEIRAHYKALIKSLSID